MPIERLSDEAARAFGRQVAAARKRKKQSQTVLAGRLGIERRYLSDLEQGLSNRQEQSSANPSLAVLAALAMELDAQIRIDQTRPGEIRVEFVFERE